MFWSFCFFVTTSYLSEMQNYLLIIRDNQACWCLSWSRRPRARDTNNHRTKFCIRWPKHPRITRHAHWKIWRRARFVCHGSGIKRRRSDFNTSARTLSLKKCDSGNLISKCRKWRHHIDKQAVNAVLSLQNVLSFENCFYSYSNSDELNINLHNSKIW